MSKQGNALDHYEKVKYKDIEGKSYYLYLKKPDMIAPENGYPVILFFFGGGWVGGTPLVFERYARLFAEIGYYCVLAEYRVKTRDDIDTPAECIKDGKSAVRWLREHYQELNIDPDRIAASGSSAGGHVALSTAVFNGFNQDEDDTSINAAPNCLILLNPVVDVSPHGYMGFMKGRPTEELLKVSPHHHMQSGTPPILIFHGTADTVVSVENAREFYKKAISLGCFCDLVEFDGEGHALIASKHSKIHNHLIFEMLKFLRKFIG